mmetsp:Transcript_19534/g.39438  ORF Transcript_19534/g.39438 Transcript_19534/m.39438 type:complete len:281 (-) Transcript_19534:247-1089(-)
MTAGSSSAGGELVGAGAQSATTEHGGTLAATCGGCGGGTGGTGGTAAPPGMVAKSLRNASVSNESAGDVGANPSESASLRPWLMLSRVVLRKVAGSTPSPALCSCCASKSECATWDQMYSVFWRCIIWACCHTNWNWADAVWTLYIASRNLSRASTIGATTSGALVRASDLSCAMYAATAKSTRPSASLESTWAAASGETPSRTPPGGGSTSLPCKPGGSGMADGSGAHGASVAVVLTSLPRLCLPLFAPALLCNMWLPALSVPLASDSEKFTLLTCPSW